MGYSYSLKSFDFYGTIPADNVPKLTEEFSYYFEIYTDEAGSVIDLGLRDMESSFEDCLAENAGLFSPGAYIEMTGDEGECFVYVIDRDSEDGFQTYNGVEIYPRSQIEADCALVSKDFFRRLPEIQETGAPVSIEFDSFDKIDSYKRYRITVEEIGRYQNGTLVMRRGVK